MLEKYYVPAGEHWVDLGSGHDPATWEAALHTINGVIWDTYSALPSDIAATLHAGLGVMLFQGYDPAAWSQPKQATIRANQAINYARSVHYPAGSVLWLDFEDCTLPATAIIPWLTQWYLTVQRSGYAPGLYVGAPQPLTSAQLYALPFTHYWRSVSTVPDVAIRGYQLDQTGANALLDGVYVDTDQVRADCKGGRPIAMRLGKDPAKSPPKPAPVVPPASLSIPLSLLTTLETQSTDLQQTIAAIHALERKDA